MIQDLEKQRQQHRARLKALREYGMGALIVLAGLFFLLRHRWGLDLNLRFPPDETDKIFGIACLLYGIWRCSRGYRWQRQHN